MSVAKILLSISALLLLMFDYRMAFKNGPIEPERKKTWLGDQASCRGPNAERGPVSWSQRAPSGEVMELRR